MKNRNNQDEIWLKSLDKQVNTTNLKNQINFPLNYLKFL